MTMGSPLKVTLHKTYVCNDSVEEHAIKTIKCTAGRGDVRWIIGLTASRESTTGAA